MHGDQPTVSRASSSYLRMCDPETVREMVGWTPCKIVGPSISRKVGLATTPGDRPTHPTIPNQPGRIAANGNKSRQKEISRNWMIFITPGANWGDENPPELRIILQPGLFFSGVPDFGLRGSPGLRIFKRTVIPAGARAVCRRNGFSISPAAFSKFSAFCRQARAESRNPGFGRGFRVTIRPKLKPTPSKGPIFWGLGF